MKPLYEHVDPFLGNDAIDLPKPEGIAATWFLPKAMAGNTHPGACTPFGMVSVCPYSGGYITGYGNYRLNTHGTPPTMGNELVASGFTHFHHSGTGNIRKFYNYLRVTPLPQDLPISAIGRRWKLSYEQAEPGWYRCRLPEIQVSTALTCSQRAARHRYRFAARSTARALIDCSVGGLLSDANMGSHPESCSISIIDQRQARGSIRVEGVDVFFHITLLGSGHISLWKGDKAHSGNRLDQPILDPDDPQPAGCCLISDDRDLDIAIGFSLGSAEKAEENSKPALDAFPVVQEQASQRWRDKLDIIEVEGGTDDERQIFASALYHSLIKPIDVSGENPHWLHGGDCFLDVATLWDQYKTQLPLIQTLYPELGGRIASAFLNTAEHYGDMPCGLLMAVDHTKFADQASCLAHQVWYGAWCRRLPGFDPHRALRLMVASFHRGQGKKLLSDERMASPTHVMDLSQAAWCTARMAEALGYDELVERFDHIADYSWRRAYDEEGMLHPGKYYEGSRATYSFRPFHAMKDRIAMSGGSTRFISQLDYFFGFTRDEVEQPGWQPSDAFMQEGIGIGGFEGLNNEPDMETPYSYSFAGRPDRTAEVIQAIRRYMFTTGRGGLPGNDDSGGLSSWYVWSALGIFPITGTALMCIGSPMFERSQIPWCGRKLTILAAGAPENPYVIGANLNGQKIDRPFLRLDELANGGTLTLEMAAEPNDWGQHSHIELRPISRR